MPSEAREERRTAASEGGRKPGGAAAASIADTRLSPRRHSWSRQATVIVTAIAFLDRAEICSVFPEATHDWPSSIRVHTRHPGSFITVHGLPTSWRAVVINWTNTGRSAWRVLAGASWKETGQKAACRATALRFSAFRDRPRQRRLWSGHGSGIPGGVGGIRGGGMRGGFGPFRLFLRWVEGWWAIRKTGCASVPEVMHLRRSPVRRGEVVIQVGAFSSRRRRWGRVGSFFRTSSLCICGGHPVCVIWNKGKEKSSVCKTGAKSTGYYVFKLSKKKKRKKNEAYIMRKLIQAS